MLRTLARLTMPALLVALSSAAPAAGAVVLYTNDLGTPKQFDTFHVTIEDGDATIVVQSANGSSNYPDLDGDGLSGNLLYNNDASDRVYLDKRYYAPLYTTIGSPRLTATGTGYRSSHGASSWLSIGVDGALLASQQTIGNVGSSSPMPLDVQLSGPGYDALLSVDMQARLEVRSGSLPSGAGLPRMGNFKLEGELNPGQIGDRVWVYKNDFGAQADLDAWTIDGASITATTAGNPSDLDNDDLQRRIEGATNGPFTTTMTVRVDALDGHRFSDPIVQAFAGGDWSNWASRVTIALSADGSDFSTVFDQTASGSTQLVASAEGVAGFEDLTSVWVRVTLQAGNTGGIRPFIQDILVSGELTAIPEPASAAIAAAGCLLILGRPRSCRS